MSHPSPRLRLLLGSLLAIIVLAFGPHALQPTAAQQLPAQLIRNLNPNVDPSVSLFPTGQAKEFATTTTTTFFVATAANGTNDLAVWKTDGSAAGTHLLMTGGAPAALTSLGDTVLFTAAPAATGRELWRSDGTVAGTTLVTEINPGPASANPTLLGIIGGRMLLAAQSATSSSLWVSDGTAAGTQQIAALDITANPFDWRGRERGPRSAIVGNQLFFVANQTQLWRSDGTTAGTQLVRDLSAVVAPAPQGGIYELRAYQGAVAFILNTDQIWRSDGTAAGTVPMANLAPQAIGDITGLTPAGGQLYCVAGTNPVTNRELWASDGTAAGTRQVRDIGPSMYDRGPTELTPFGSGVVFAAEDSAGIELWRSDGTEAGTRLVADQAIRPLSSNPQLFMRLRYSVLFVVTTDTLEVEFWGTDGTPEGTRLLTTVSSYSTIDLPKRKIFDGVLYMTVRLDGRPAVLVSDGTPEGTRIVHSATSYNAFPTYVEANGIVYFAYYHMTDASVGATRLWRTDGTPSGTRLIASVDVPPGFSNASGLGVVNGQVLLFANQTLWKSDGDSPALLRLVDFNRVNEEAGGVAFVLGTTDTAIYLWQFYGNASYNLGRLWRSDGTILGTSEIARIDGQPYPDTQFPAIFVHESDIYVMIRPAAAPTQQELWVTNGACDGTRRLGAFPGGTFDRRQRFGHINDRVLFIPHDQLWATDGTITGTQRLGTVHPMLHDSDEERFFNPVGNKVYFNGDDGIHGTELWATDGTPGGTTLIKDINPGPASSFAGNRVAARTDGLLLFAANDGTHGYEPWASDGTATGTRLLQDIKPGPTSGMASFSGVMAGTSGLASATNSWYPDYELWGIDLA